jgi:hypothetical protein
MIAHNPEAGFLLDIARRSKGALRILLPALPINAIGISGQIGDIVK